MKKIVTLLLLSMVLFACTPQETVVIVVTATPVPPTSTDIPTATTTSTPTSTPTSTSTTTPTPVVTNTPQDPTPTQEIRTLTPTPVNPPLNNPHGLCVQQNPTSWGVDCRINTNMQEFQGTISVFRDPLKDPRTADVPQGYAWYENRNDTVNPLIGKGVDSRCYGGSFARDCFLNIGWSNGKSGYSWGFSHGSEMRVYANQCYLVKLSARFTLGRGWITDYKTTDKGSFEQGQVGVGGFITKQGRNFVLPSQWFTNFEQPTTEFIWAIQPITNWSPNFTVYADVPWGIFWDGVNVVFESVELIAVPQGFCSNPIRF